MSVSATTQTLEQGPRNLSMHWTGLGDGAGNEENVVKVDVSNLTPACSTVKVMRITGTVAYGVVELYWDALVPKKFAELSGDVFLDFTRVGGLANNAVGRTGDVLLSTVGFELNSSYDLAIEMVKKS